MRSSCNMLVLMVDTGVVAEEAFGGTGLPYAHSLLEKPHMQYKKICRFLRSNESRSMIASVWQMGGGRGGMIKGQRKCLVVMDFIIVIVAMVSRMYIYVKMDQITHSYM